MTRTEHYHVDLVDAGNGRLLDSWHVDSEDLAELLAADGARWLTDGGWRVIAQDDTSYTLASGNERRRITRRTCTAAH